MTAFRYSDNSNFFLPLSKEQNRKFALNCSIHGLVLQSPYLFEVSKWLLCSC